MHQYKISEGNHSHDQKKTYLPNSLNINDLLAKSTNTNHKNSAKTIVKMSKSNSEERSINKRKIRHIDLKNYSNNVYNQIHKRYYLDQSFQLPNKSNSLKRSKSGHKSTLTNNSTNISMPISLPLGYDLKMLKDKEHSRYLEIDNSFSHLNTSINNCNSSGYMNTTTSTTNNNTSYIMNKTLNEIDKENIYHHLSTITKAYSNDSINKNQNYGNNVLNNRNINNIMNNSIFLAQDIDDKIDYNNENKIKEIIEKYELRDINHRKEIYKLNSSNNFLKSHISSLQDQLDKFNQFKEQSIKYITNLENELKAYRDKQITTNKNDKPVQGKSQSNKPTKKIDELTKQLHKLESEKIFLERLLKNTLLDNQMSKAKEKDIYNQLWSNASLNKYQSNKIIENDPSAKPPLENKAKVNSLTEVNNMSIAKINDISMVPLVQDQMCLKSESSTSFITHSAIPDKNKDLPTHTNLFVDTQFNDSPNGNAHNIDNKNHQVLPPNNCKILAFDVNMMDSLKGGQSIDDDESVRFFYSRRVQAPQNIQFKEKLDLRLDLSRIYLEREKSSQQQNIVDQLSCTTFTCL